MTIFRYYGKKKDCFNIKLPDCLKVQIVLTKHTTYTALLLR